MLIKKYHIILILGDSIMLVRLKLGYEALDVFVVDETIIE